MKSTKTKYQRFRGWSGISVIELLIVIGIIGLLIQLAIPGVRAARESARRTQCSNNLRQVGLAVGIHESAHGSFPTGGWGWAWIGDPNRGVGKDQPGGWAYQLLPYMEQQAIHDLGLGSDIAERPTLIAELAATPVSLFYCPTRRQPLATPTQNPQVAPEHAPDTGDLFWYNSTYPELCARLDYVANNGDKFMPWPAGPSAADYDELGEKAFQWQRIPTEEDLADGEKKDFRLFTGIVGQRYPIEFRQVTDGLSKTYFAMEKRIPSWHYKTGRAANDNQCAWSGTAWDIAASTYWPPFQDPSPDQRSDYKNLVDPWGGNLKAADSRDRVGSAHSTGFNVVFCDGSVRYLPYDIDPLVHRNGGNRAGTLPVD